MDNEEYHDILDAIKAANADFRYVSEDADGHSFEIEAYQISPRSRYQNAEWPSWLKMQMRPDDINAVYCDSDSPDNLTLALTSGEQLLTNGDWVVRFANGDLSALSASEFANFKKVVPVPDKPYVPPADDPNAPDPRKATATVSEVPKPKAPDDSDIDTVICEALSNLQNGKAGLAQEILTKSLAGRVDWCSCVPGSCADGPLMGCRRNSPLVKGNV